MTCTDHDLKRFKYFCHEDGAIGTFLVTKLIARLEAAEEVCKGLDKFHHSQGCACSICDCMEAWRKACGK